ncbi:ribosomal L1 domain-containing protein CG13096 [Haematobia irritans]|uniref:ribosomal L1 domain-containing protein CG13096 n=1 Tax=Haematobia irritans TaxID=7368 RepID=UPI003F5072F3
MVKVQKPTPKTLKDAPKKQNKNNNHGIKKEKTGKDPKVAVETKKAKTKLIEKAVQEKQLDQVKPMKKKDAAAKEQKEGKKSQNKTNQGTKTKSTNNASTPANSKKALKTKNEAENTKTIANDSKAKLESNKADTKAKATPAVTTKPKLSKKQKKDLKKIAQKSLKNKSKNDQKSQTKEGNTEAKTSKPLKNKKPKTKKPQQKKKPKVPSVEFEQQPFDEEKFNKVVNEENIKKVAKALKKLVEKEVSEKKTSIFSDFRYFLNVSSYKIPNCPKRMVKLNLKHSLVDPKEDDVVIIVPDLERGAKVDYEPTIQHYEDAFREAGVSNLKIVPFNQLRKECTTFEAKRKFANTYDYFLCDGRIVGHVVGFCGNNFQKPRTTFHAVRLNDPKTYKQEIERSLKRSAYKQLNKGDLTSIPVGNHRYTIDQLADNIQMVINQLKTLYPGGLGNVRQMHMKIDITGTSSMPLYVNLAGPPAETPNVVGLREQRMLKLKKEANDVLEQFNLSKSGEFVKLDKNQVERKRQIKQARQALIVADGETQETPSKKAKRYHNEEADNNEKSEDEESDAEEDSAEEDVGEEDSQAEEDGEEDSEEEEEDDDDE